MNTKITRDVLESHLKCSYKGYLKLAGDQGTKTDYELMLAESRQRLQAAVTERLTHRHSDGDALRGPTLSRRLLDQGAGLILDGILASGVVSVTFDGLVRTNGASHLGDFHYIPVLFYEGGKIRQEQKLLLASLSLMLTPVQGVQAARGIIAHGEEGTLATVKLTPKLLKKAQHVLEELRQASGLVPRLMLNEHCNICEFRSRCNAQAEKDDDISLLRGLGEKEIKRYNRKGIFTLTQLSCTFRARRRAKRAKKVNYARYAALQALAIREKKVYVYGSPSLPDKAVRVFLDIEGIPDSRFVYLIGAIVCDGASEKAYSFWADSTDQEQGMYENLLDVLGQYEDFCVYHYGTYEKAFLRTMVGRAGRKGLAAKALANAVNVLSVVHANIYFPTLSNGLKDIGTHLGFSWTEKQASGLQSLVWRWRWEQTKEQAWKDKLLTYNLEDCAALKRVTESILAIIDAGKRRDNKGGAADNGVDIGVSVGWAEDFRPPSNRRELGRPSFVLPEFDQINRCAYFDYQREKVFLRTSKTIRKACARQRKRGTKKLRPNRKIEITARTCPFCGNTELARCGGKVHVKVAYDLSFSTGGIRRQVIHCTAAHHRCKRCAKSFLPSRYKRRDKHFHGLKSWAMYQHVVHRISFEGIEAMFEECFGLRVCLPELHMMKSLVAQHYRSTWKGILERIVSGNVIHVDETLANLQKGKGYVWVLTNLEEVVYLYRATREGDFLEDLLRGFSGVLVSDFFSAYDGLPCKQQKCLVHLIRDFNSDLLSSPYDDEFRSLASEFGQLLRGIIATIDRYGLVRRHLHKHQHEVDRFFRVLSARHYRSELADGYQNRLLKNVDKLFTFLNHDGVPWNNNNAEHAIKRFAYYRRIADGKMTESGLSNYLVLLSIYETCRFKGVSFLKFLLSKEKDIDKFCQEGPKKYEPAFLELYPKGFPRVYPRKNKARDASNG